MQLDASHLIRLFKQSFILLKYVTSYCTLIYLVRLREVTSWKLISQTSFCFTFARCAQLCGLPGHTAQSPDSVAESGSASPTFFCHLYTPHCHEVICLDSVSVKSKQSVRSVPWEVWGPARSTLLLPLGAVLTLTPTRAPTVIGKKMKNQSS